MADVFSLLQSPLTSPKESSIFCNASAPRSSMRERSSLSEQPNSPSWLGSATEFFTPLYELLAMSPGYTVSARVENGVPKGELYPQKTNASSSHKQLTSFKGGGGGCPTAGGRTGISHCHQPVALHSWWMELYKNQPKEICGEKERNASLLWKVLNCTMDIEFCVYLISENTKHFKFSQLSTRPENSK